ncbi:tetratricopeptide repeat-containing sensor histidine kinase [Aquimarina longa]|uniref:tetratricopeptide repeat-containing sensor histidine kinase n=1 Tax=Aquimarina longa TaxID=1080221 RepID=UPI000785D8DC|nr:tetratricopeptide repeat protein [Aquimarina longa]
MKIIYIITLFITVCNIYTIHSQNDTNKVLEIQQNLKKSKELIHKNLDSSLFYSDKAIQLSKLIINDTLISKSNLQKSSVLIYKKKFSEADSLLQYNLTKKLPKHIEGQTWHNIGTIQYYKQNFKKALGIYIKASKILEQVKESTQLVDTYSNIATINASLKNFANAEKYLERALSISSDSNKAARLKILVNLSIIYHEQKLFKKYISSISKAEKLAEKYNSKNALSIIYTNQSKYYSDTGDNYDYAIEYGKKAIAIKKELKRIQNLYFTYNNVGYSYLKKEEYKKAIVYLDSALHNAQPTAKPIIYNNLKDAYSGLKNYKSAVHYANLKDQIKDSITSAQQKEKVAELTEKFESEKKQQQINILDTKNELQAFTIQQQNYLLVVLAVFVILFLILGYFGFKNYKTKQQLNTLLLQQKLRKTQLNPHFLFNALQSIQNFIYQNDKEKSSSYLTSYSKLIRFILEKSDDNFSSVSEDRLALESYLNLQQLNNNNSFSYTVTVEDTVDEDFDMLPTLITQPFVENAILHGLKNNSNGVIAVKYYKNNNDLYISIIDNGKGYDAPKEDSKRLHKSMSMNIIKEQLKNLNRTSGNFKGIIDIQSSPKGTKVSLKFTTVN